jgi:hypothetical protein
MKRIGKTRRAIIAVLRFCETNFHTFETDFRTLGKRHLCHVVTDSSHGFF